jgi:hypothetical protein
MYGQLDVRLTDPLITHGDFIWTGNIQCDKIEHTQQTELACVQEGVKSAAPHHTRPSEWVGELHGSERC